MYIFDDEWISTTRGDEMSREKITWHGHTQHPDSHPELPWWRWNPDCTCGNSCVGPGRWYHEGGDYYTATSRDDTRTDELRVYDEKHPRPAPEPACGQVWVMDIPDSPAGPRSVRMVVSGVDAQAGIVRAVRISHARGRLHREERAAMVRGRRDRHRMGRDDMERAHAVPGWLDWFANPARCHPRSRRRISVGPGWTAQRVTP